MIPLKKILASSTLLLAIAIGWLQIGCEKGNSINPEELTIRLRWAPNQRGESWQNVKTGLIWAFSYLGAEWPIGSFDASVTRHGEFSLVLDCQSVGFSPQAIQALKPILKELKLTEEYQKMKGVDLGRFLLFVAHSSWHYYALTHAPPNIDAYLSEFQNEPFHDFYLSHSSIAIGERKIRFTTPKQYNQIAYIGMEGTGSLALNTFTPREFECIRLMPNGQLQFLIYGKNGHLLAAPDSTLSTGGKPGKCQWCHEKSLLPLYVASDEFGIGITRNQFLQNIESNNRLIDDFRKSLQTEITYENPQDHQFAELLVLAFEEPSILHLSKEWGIDTLSLKEKLAGIPSHINQEHPALGPLYFRQDIEKFSPYHGINVPHSSREFTGFEPDLLHIKP